MEICAEKIGQFIDAKSATEVTVPTVPNKNYGHWSASTSIETFIGVAIAHQNLHSTGEVLLRISNYHLIMRSK